MCGFRMVKDWKKKKREFVNPLKIESQHGSLELFSLISK